MGVCIVNVYYIYLYYSTVLKPIMHIQVDADFSARAYIIIRPRRYDLSPKWIDSMGISYLFLDLSRGLCPCIRRKENKGIVHHSLRVLHTPSMTCMCVRMPKGMAHPLKTILEAKTSYSGWISVLRRLANDKSRICGGEIPKVVLGSGQQRAQVNTRSG